MKLLPVVAEPTEVETEPVPEVWRHVIEVQLGEAAILVSEHAMTCPDLLPDLVRLRLGVRS